MSTRFFRSRIAGVSRAILQALQRPAGLVILLCSFQCYASGGGALDSAEGATAQDPVQEEASLWRLLDRQYLLDDGIDLPEQWGVAAFYSQTQSELPIGSLKFALKEGEPLESSPIVSMDDLDNKITNTGIILDYWVLPMLDLYTILGYSDGKMNTAVNVDAENFPKQPIGFKFTGTSYAGGATLVTAYKQAILIFDYNYMLLDTDVYEKKIPVSNITVRAGWNFGQKKFLPKNAWVSYITTEFEGTFDLQAESSDLTDTVFLEFEVDKYSTWAMGAQWDLAKHYTLIAEYGFGTVDGITFALNYRWE